jgi:hypothetical protein
MASEERISSTVFGTESELDESRVESWEIE